MRKQLLILMMAALLMFPSLAFAQADTKLTSVNVQLWPEFDQPSMLVIVDYTVPTDTKLPVSLKFRIPQEGNLVAVANYTPEGALVNAAIDEPKVEGEWKVFAVTLESMEGHFEYYQPITFNGEQRTYSYLWDNPYEIDAFGVNVREPSDTTSLTTIPKLDVPSEQQGTKYHSNKPVKLAANEQFTLNLEYKRISDALAVSSAPVQPAAPLDDNTTGMVTFNKSLPYVIGGVGLLLMIGGVVYYLQSEKTGLKKSRRRIRGKSNEEEDGDDVYCSQCGTRARGGDRFCRTCGSRIKQQED